MSIVPFLTSDQKLFDRVIPLVGSCEGCEAELVQISKTEEALEFLNVEMPDLVFINFSDPVIDSFVLLESILKDSWLLHGSIVAFCHDYATSERLEKIRGANIVISLIADDVERHLPKILSIIVNNKRILFQRAIGSDLIQTISGSYRIDNDPIEANCHANLVCNYLFNANKLDVDGKMTLNLALTEMLMNAIEHGNCGITYQQKSQWLETGGVMIDLIEKTVMDPAVGDKRVLFEYTIAPHKTTFVIADEGAGFDWRSVKDATAAENVLELHGRGIMLTRRFTRNLTYNEKGNEVTFEIEHVKDRTNAFPALFENMEPIKIKKGDIVFSEGETSDFLYYIAKGRYDVLVKNTIVSTLTADDIFMGEMSFLLNNRRSATVRAKTSGTLIRISKKDFVEAIKHKPHYALFLSRLLAQRIQRTNAKKSDE